MATTARPTEAEIDRYLEGRLNPADMARVERYLTASASGSSHSDFSTSASATVDPIEVNETLVRSFFQHLTAQERQRRLIAVALVSATLTAVLLF